MLAVPAPPFLALRSLPFVLTLLLNQHNMKMQSDQLIATRCCGHGGGWHLSHQIRGHGCFGINCPVGKNQGQHSPPALCSLCCPHPVTWEPQVLPLLPSFKAQLTLKVVKIR